MDIIPFKKSKCVLISQSTKSQRGKRDSIVKIMLGMYSFSNVAFKMNLKNAKCLFSVSLHATTLYLSYFVYFLIYNYGELIVEVRSLIIKGFCFDF